MRWLVWLWPFGRQYEIRMLNRDAPYIIADATERFSDDRLGQMANATRAYIESAHENLSRPNFEIDNVIPHYQSLHRDARKKREDTALSALTLVIIYLRAQKHPDGCDPALAAIQSFVDEWSNDSEDEAGSAGSIGRMEA